MPGNARLAQPEDLSQLTHGQLHFAQEGDNAQPCGVRKGLEGEECAFH